MENTESIEVVDENTALAQYDFGDDAGQGYDPNAAADIQIPRLKVLQPLSPEVTDELEGAKPGLLINTASKEIFESCDFIVAKTEKCFNEWISREDGGGFVGRHEANSSIVLQALKKTPRGKIVLDNGHELIETVYMYVVPVDENKEPTGSFAVIDFTSTKLAAWRQWNTSVQMFTVPVGDRKVRPPLWAHTVRLTTKKIKNDKGVFHNFVLGAAGKNLKEALLPNKAHPAYRAAQELAGLVEQGLAKPQMEPQESSSDSDEGYDEGNF